MLSSRSAPVLLAGSFVLFGLAGWALRLPLGLDSAVYRSGALAVLRGEALYDHLTATPEWAVDLPFTYPPVAAVLFTPLAVLPTQLTWAVFAVATAFGVGVVLRWTTGRTPSPLLFAAVFGLEPVWRTVGYGQVNVLLMAVVVVDVLRQGRFSGVLVGIAAAVKLTPLVFVLHLLVTGRVRDAGRALAVFGGLQLLGFLLLPGDSLRYWGSAVLRGNDATGNGHLANQSISGAVQRLTGAAPWAPLLVAALCLGCVAAAAVLARRAHLRGEPLGALLVTAFCGLLVSPISWSHHWVWVVPLVAFLLRGPGAAQVPVWAVFVLWPLLVPTGNAVLDNLYVLVAVVGGVLAWRGLLSGGGVGSARVDDLPGRWGG
ncbi:glycosyltransferase 87 family protein [Lentzea chajnantorensis]